jgi:hypothetical protein
MTTLLAAEQIVVRKARVVIQADGTVNEILEERPSYVKCRN